MQVPDLLRINAALIGFREVVSSVQCRWPFDHGESAEVGVTLPTAEADGLKVDTED